MSDTDGNGPNSIAGDHESGNVMNSAGNNLDDKERCTISCEVMAFGSNDKMVFVQGNFVFYKFSVGSYPDFTDLNAVIFSAEEANLDGDTGNDPNSSAVALGEEEGLESPSNDFVDESRVGSITVIVTASTDTDND